MGKTKITINNIIRRLRFDADEMTQKELAERIGVTRQTVVAIEKAKYGPSLELAFLIAQVFDVPLEDVFQVSIDGTPITTPTETGN
ncbi:MAG: transcriptional regulator [Geminicoccus sp.]|nr:transcriptional regulator [Geminicoccus sp.]MDB2403588.1 helix-turn-helix transcriptional regulator [bacterium]